MQSISTAASLTEDEQYSTTLQLMQSVSNLLQLFINTRFAFTCSEFIVIWWATSDGLASCSQQCMANNQLPVGRALTLTGVVCDCDQTASGECEYSQNITIHQPDSLADMSFNDEQQSAKTSQCRQGASG